jgi:hypothetical protein
MAMRREFCLAGYKSRLLIDAMRCTFEVSDVYQICDRIGSDQSPSSETDDVVMRILVALQELRRGFEGLKV